MKNRKLFFKRFVMGIVIFFMAVFELQMIWGSVYISKTVTKERRNNKQYNSYFGNWDTIFRSRF